MGHFPLKISHHFTHASNDECCLIPIVGTKLSLPAISVMGYIDVEVEVDVEVQFSCVPAHTCVRNNDHLVQLFCSQ